MHTLSGKNFGGILVGNYKVFWSIDQSFAVVTKCVSWSYLFGASAFQHSWTTRPWRKRFQHHLGRELQFIYHLLVVLQSVKQWALIMVLLNAFLIISLKFSVNVPEILGKCGWMKFDNKKGEEEWYEALYSMITGNPLDGQTEEASFWWWGLRSCLLA